MSSLISKYKIELLLWVSIVAFIAYFSFAAINRLLTLRSNYYDLGIMDQVVYNTSQGRFLEMTNQELGHNASRFAIHFDPILALFAPFYLLYSNPNVLLIGQVIVVALGAWAVYLIANYTVKNKIAALCFALTYMFYFPNQRAVLFDFHGVVIATTCLLFMIYFMLIKKYWAMLVFLLFALLTKEHVGLVTFLFGLYMFFIRSERRFSFVVMAVSLVFFVVTMMYIIPSARADAHFALRFYDDLGDSPSNIMINLVKNPLYIVGKINNPDGVAYLARLFLAPILLIIFAPFEFLISLPEVLINLISTSANMRMIYFHYNAVIVPFVFFSMIVGYKNMMHVVKRVAIRERIVVMTVVFFLINIYLYAPAPFGFFPNNHLILPVDTEQMNVLYYWQNKLADPDLSVATSPKIAPFFTHRKHYYNFLFDSGYKGAGISEHDIIKNIDNYTHAEYVVLTKGEVVTESLVEKDFYNHLKENADYKLIFDLRDVMVYKR